MIALDLSPETRWIDLVPGVRIRVRPMSSALWLAALAQVPLPGPGGGENAAAAAAGHAEASFALVAAVAGCAILEWEGVGNLEGAAIPPSAAAVAALLARRDAWEAFNRLYLDPWWLLGAEKNVSAPSPAGTSAGARPTAATATVPAPTAPHGGTPR